MQYINKGDAEIMVKRSRAWECSCCEYHIEIKEIFPEKEEKNNED
jgi:hypothetical protein